MARNSGVRLSSLLKITDETWAVDIDRAMSARLLVYDRERDKGLAKTIAFEVAKMFAGSTDDLPVMRADEL